MSKSTLTRRNLLAAAAPAAITAVAAATVPASPALATAAPDPVLALCHQLDKAEVQFDRAEVAYRDAEAAYYKGSEVKFEWVTSVKTGREFASFSAQFPNTPEGTRLCGAMSDAQEICDDLLEQIRVTRATSVEGIVRKAVLVETVALSSGMLSSAIADLAAMLRAGQA